MRISDWSADGCSSDLCGTVIAQAAADLDAVRTDQRNQIAVREIALDAHHANRQQTAALFAQDARGAFVEMQFAVQLHLAGNPALARRHDAFCRGEQTDRKSVV